jgi:hypothetical protein
MLGLELNSALAFWILTRIVVPACGVLLVLTVIVEYQDWKKGKR